jgi:hypothetical protein
MAQFKALPKNAKLNPADKTLQWEVTLGKSIILWAHEQGYRGNQPLPTFTYTSKLIASDRHLNCSSIAVYCAH